MTMGDTARGIVVGTVVAIIAGGGSAFVVVQVNKARLDQHDVTIRGVETRLNQYTEVLQQRIKANAGAVNRVNLIVVAEHPDRVESVQTASLDFASHPRLWGDELPEIFGHELGAGDVPRLLSLYDSWDATPSDEDFMIYRQVRHVPAPDGD